MITPRYLALLTLFNEQSSIFRECLLSYLILVQWEITNCNNFSCITEIIGCATDLKLIVVQKLSEIFNYDKLLINEKKIASLSTNAL